jgi:hypothetical protein
MNVAISAVPDRCSRTSLAFGRNGSVKRNYSWHTVAMLHSISRVSGVTGNEPWSNLASHAIGKRRSCARLGKTRHQIARIEPLEDRRLLSAVPAAHASTTSLTINEQPGVNFTADLGSFTTIAPATRLKAIIHWGDGKTSKGTLKATGVVGLDEISCELDGTHTYADAGTYAITASVIRANRARPIAKFSDSAIVAAVAANNSTSFNGTITGTYIPEPTAADLGAGYALRGKGTVGILGDVTAQGNLMLPGFITSGHANGTLVLTSTSTSADKSGSVTLQLTGPLENGFGPLPTTLSFTITSGTGAYADASGTGTIAVTFGGSQNPSTLAFTFVLTSLPTPTPA